MKTPFVEQDGKLYVEMLSTGIPPLCVCASGLTVCTWPKDKRTYIPIEQAIRWHERELKLTHDGSGSRKILVALMKAHKRFQSCPRLCDAV